MSEKWNKTYDIGRVPHYTDLAERFIFPFPQVNFLLNGGVLDRVTMITSSTDNGKTTFASQVLMSILEQGYKVCAFFGEDTARESQERLFKQATASNRDAIRYVPYEVNGKRTNCGEFILTDEAFEKAKAKFEGKLYLYNTLESADIDSILEAFEYERVNHGCRVFLLDNVEQFDFASENENKAVRDIVIKIRDYAINKKVHIFLVAHIRKIDRDNLCPDLNDVKGTSAMVNIAKNVLVVVRTDKMPKDTQAYKSLASVVRLNNYNLDDADCLVKVAKTKGRKLGYVCLKFDGMTQTYRECKKIDEHKDEGEKAVVVPKTVQTKLDEVAITIEEDDNLPF